MEQAVYVCGWSLSSDGYTLWVKSRPGIRAAGATYVEAEAKLIKSIQHAGGAVVAVLEFDPALPKSTGDAKFSNPEIYLDMRG
jgi:hypothetical protein